jgi:phage terminase large subunit-like protein
LTSSPNDDAGAPAELGAFARFCSALRLEDGKPLELEPFQLTLLHDHFAGARETVVLLSKKNGKTTLLAALALYHLITTPDAECVIGAASRDQATILYDQAAGFVRRSPGLERRVEVKGGYRQIWATRDDGRVRVLAADVDTADGVIPTLALVDELHRHKSAGLYGVFRDGLGPRSGRMITISTAGDSEASPLGLMRAEAHKLPHLRRDGMYTHAASADGLYVLHEWALGRDDNVDDLELVKQANPASWQTIEALRARHDSPSMLPWQWARFACGIWTASEEWWVTGDQWRAGEAHDALIPGDRIALGFDGARTGDATAIVGCRLADGLIELLRVWEPAEDPDWQVPAGEVDAAIATAMETFDVARGYFDPPLWQTEIENWQREFGSPAVTVFRTNRSAMLAAIERFRTDLIEGRLRHSGDEVLSRHILNARTREVRGGYWLMKQRAGQKIDAAIAAVLAYEARADALMDADSRPGRLTFS